MLIVFTVRPYTGRDLRQVIRVYQKAFAEPPWNEIWSDDQVIEDMRFAFSQKDSFALVAEEKKDQLAGFTWGYLLPLEKFPFLQGRVKESSSYMDEVAVSKETRRKGIGSLLCQAYIEKVAEQGIQEIVLRTDQRNTASMALFQKNGFRSLGIYDPKYQDRIYLARSISSRESPKGLLSPNENIFKDTKPIEIRRGKKCQ